MLLQRTTRSVALTAAGARLLEGLGPAFAEIDAAYLIPTPANTAYLGLVYEAMRGSIEKEGMPVVIDYDRGVTRYRTLK